MKRTDLLLLISVYLVTFFGLFMIYDASSYVAFRDFGDKYRYVKDQFLWIILGSTALFSMSFFDYKKFYNLAIPILVGAIILLILVLIPGIGLEILGARRWIDLGFTVIQPSEFAKLALTIYLAAWFSTKEKGRFLAFLLILGLIIFLVMLQPDMGTAVITLGIALIIYFLSGGSIFHIISLIPVVLAGGIGLILVEPYRANRLMTFLNPDEGVLTTSYHLKQILIALGSGGLLGVGFGNSLQKYAYLPESTTDSIFAIIGEEVGFVGVVILILIFVFIIYQGFLIATKAKDNFGKLLASGITSFIALQAVVNLSAQTALMPLTGVPLPFISYGGSALVINLFAVGILISISKRSGLNGMNDKTTRKKRNFNLPKINI